MLESKRDPEAQGHLRVSVILTEGLRRLWMPLG